MNDQELNSIDIAGELKASFNKRFGPKPEDPQTTKIKEKFRLMREEWTKIIQNHAEAFGNLKKLGDHQGSLFSDRQRLVEHIFDFQEKVEKTYRILKQNRQYAYKQYEQEKIKTDKQLMLLIDSDVSAIEERYNLMVNHHGYLNETLKSIDHLLYAVKSRISLEEYT